MKRLVVILCLAAVPVRAAAPPAAKTAPVSSPKAADRGDVKLSYEKSEKYKALAQALGKGKVLEKLIPEINRTISLPKDISVVYRECGEEDASFDPEKAEIQVCFELVDSFGKKLSKMEQGHEKVDLSEIRGNIVKFVFLHELGHALIDVLDLATTGKEEDVVDQLATFILIEGEDFQAAVDGAVGMSIIDDPKEIAEVDDLAFWDEHSLSPQRFFNILCWVYGSDVDAFGDELVKDEDGPLHGKESRTGGCEREYSTIKRAWTKLLRRHLKDQ